MANKDVIVTVSGAALSLLFYENVRHSNDQIGFLLGNVSLFVTKKVTDSEKVVEQERKQINITSIITCPTTESFYDSKGSIDCQKINKYVQDKKNRIVGWFRMRKNMNLVLTLRDKILHKEFANYFCGMHGINHEEFVMCLLITSVNNTRSTHKFQHIFYRYKNSCMEPLLLKIHNLADDATSYKPAPEKYSNKNTDSLSKYIENIRDEISNMSGIDAVLMIQKAAESQLKVIIPELCETEHRIANLESEIQKMKQRFIENKDLSFLDSDSDNYNSKGIDKQYVKLGSTRELEDKDSSSSDVVYYS